MFNKDVKVPLQEAELVGTSSSNKKLIAACETEGRERGPAFAMPDGRLALMVDYDAMFRRYLVQVQEDRSLIPED